MILVNEMKPMRICVEKKYENWIISIDKTESELKHQLINYINEVLKAMKENFRL